MMKRVLWSSFNVARTCKKHIVYLSAVFGILLIFFGQWLSTMSYAEKSKLVVPLQQTDAAIDQVISGLNFLTQTLPLDAENWLNVTIQQAEQEALSLLVSAEQALTKPVNHIEQGIANCINELVVWGKKNAGDNSPWVYQALPAFIVNVPTFLNVTVSIPLLDLSAAKIPQRDFSVESTLTPFIDKVFDIPLTVAYYLIAAGATLVAYAAARILIAMLVPWVPHLTVFKKFALFWKCLKLTSQAFKNLVTKFLKPWIHIPFIIGLVLTVVIALLLFAAIYDMQNNIQQPLQNADLAILDVIWKINNFTVSIPPKVNGFIDNFEDLISLKAQTVVDDSLQSFEVDLGNGFTQIGNVLNTILSTFGNVLISTIIPDQPLIPLFGPFLPHSPRINLNALLLPESLAAIESTLNPWVDDRIREFYQVATVLLIIAIVLMVVPGMAMCGAFMHPFIPHSLNEFFLKPDYAEESDEPATELELDDSERSRAARASDRPDIAVSEPKFVEAPRKSIKSDFSVSEPKFVEAPKY